MHPSKLALTIALGIFCLPVSAANAAPLAGTEIIQTTGEANSTVNGTDLGDRIYVKNEWYTEILAGKGDDFIVLQSDGVSLADGGPGDDIIVTSGSGAAAKCGTGWDVVYELYQDNSMSADDCERVLHQTYGPIDPAQLRTVHGTSGDDTLAGSQINDYIDGGPFGQNGNGFDRLWGYGGNDYLHGEFVWGGTGDDNLLLEKPSADRWGSLDGGAGNDLLSSPTYGGVSLICGDGRDVALSEREWAQPAGSLPWHPGCERVRFFTPPVAYPAYGTRITRQAPPEITAVSLPTIATVGVPVTLQVSATGAPSSTEPATWHLNDGKPSPKARTISHTFPHVGKTQIRVLVRNSDGRISDVVEHTVDVRPQLALPGPELARPVPGNFANGGQAYVFGNRATSYAQDSFAVKGSTHWFSAGKSLVGNATTQGAPSGYVAFTGSLYDAVTRTYQTNSFVRTSNVASWSCSPIAANHFVAKRHTILRQRNSSQARTVSTIPAGAVVQLNCGNAFADAYNSATGPLKPTYLRLVYTPAGSSTPVSGYALRSAFVS
jgi:hypothetical protein